MLGDSISAAYGIQREQGWVHLLDQYLTANHPGWRVVNASISGETTGGGLARLPGVLDSVAPKIVIVELGVMMACAVTRCKNEGQFAAHS
ncbi:MAG: hypothetical protein CM15mP120_25380 [Pseudomonadota bacterium]|nr:MAG: hypothetical protein CM15mP120_25380 [Pseudomonadota bacterium]